MNNDYKDTFKLIAPGMRDSNNRNVVRVPPSTYDRLAVLSRETGVSMCRIVEQCVNFAFERMDGGNDDAQ